MDEFKIIKTYSTPFTNPIVLEAGEEVKLGKEDEKWKGWVWAENETNKDWVPVQILDISEDRQRGKVLEFYNAKELNVGKGDRIEKIKSLNGWTWSKNIRTNEEGWVPDEIIE